MKGETALAALLKTLKPELNEGDYVFCTVDNNTGIDIRNAIGTFKEKEGLTVILDKKYADQLNLNYSFIAAWITLTVHSSLEAVGLTAAFSNALSNANISCNVIAAFYHDHIFVEKKYAGNAMDVLLTLQNTSR